MHIKGIDKCCLGCKRRYEGCHSSCPTYKTAKRMYENEKARIKAERDKEYACHYHVLGDFPKKFCKK